MGIYLWERWSYCHWGIIFYQKTENVKQTSAKRIHLGWSVCHTICVHQHNKVLVKAVCSPTYLRELAPSATAQKPESILRAYCGGEKQTQNLWCLPAGMWKWKSNSDAWVSRDCQEWVPGCSWWLRLFLAHGPSPGMPAMCIELRPMLASSFQEKSRLFAALLWMFSLVKHSKCGKK